MTHRLTACLLIAVISIPSLNAQQQSVTRPAILGIACVALRAADLAQSRNFYSGLLGYDLTAGRDPHELTVTISPRQFIRIRDGLLPGQDERLSALAFQTDDVAAMRKYLQAHQVQVPATLSKDAGGMLFFAVEDPDGHTVQFVQYPVPDHAQAHPAGQPGLSTRILHAGLTVSSVAAADSFYHAILGFSEIWRGGSSDSVTSWINMRVPDGTDYLEYMLVNKPAGRQELGGLHHIALLVPDMQQAVDVLNSRKALVGLPVASPRIGRNRRWQLNLFDPDGTRIELMEPFPMR